MQIRTMSPARLAYFISLLATALALGGALAHAFKLPNEIALSQPDA